MKAVLRWLLCTAATASLVTLFAQYPAVNNQAPTDINAVDIAQTAPLTADDAAVIEPALPAPLEGYYLREYDGRLAVFQSGNEEPLHVFNVSIATMSEYDQTELREGIFAESLNDLRSLVEDYTS